MQKHGRAARPKSLHAPDEEISQRYEEQSQRVFHVDLASARLVLPLGSGKFRHVLEVGFKKLKKGQILLIAAAMKLLPHGSGNFDHGPSLGNLL